MVTHSNWTPTFEWYMVTFVFKNEHKKDTRYNEIGRCAKNINTILDSHVDKVERGLCM
jgi:hypothetical protein